MYERMLDKKAEPSMPELVAHCGICGDIFADINGYLTKEFETETEIRFPYGNLECEAQKEKQAYL